LRNPSDQTVYEPGDEPVSFLDRGYTSHEQLPQFGLINMNARLYDPTVGRFLAPDPYVQAPDFSQSFNRYSYCLNNPLRYTDENGEFWNFVIGAVVGGVVNWATHGCKFNAKGLSYFGVGAAVGLATAGLGSWAAGATKALGVLPGAVVGAGTGAASGAASSFTLNGLNNVIDGQKFLDNWGQSVISGAISGAVSGAISGGMKGYQNAKAKGANVWTGDKTVSKNSYSATIKNGIPAQTDPTKGCYSVVDEYASSGRDNFTRTDFGTQAQADINGTSIPDAADPLVTYANKTGKAAYAINNWETVGKGIHNGTIEAMGVVSNNGTNHAVNLVSLTVETKLKIFGGGVKQILSATTFWDPLIGRTTPGYSSFINVGYFKY
jgi:RHS repeat-associated protein